MTSIFIREKFGRRLMSHVKTDPQGDGHVKMESEPGVMHPQVKERCHHQSWEEARKDPSSIRFRGSVALLPP